MTRYQRRRLLFGWCVELERIDEQANFEMIKFQLDAEAYGNKTKKKWNGGLGWKIASFVLFPETSAPS